jgi:hypothetical protein
MRCATASRLRMQSIMTAFSQQPALPPGPVGLHCIRRPTTRALLDHPQIAMHTEYYTQPKLQKHVIRILLMVPIYAVDAWFALRFREVRSRATGNT